MGPFQPSFEDLGTPLGDVTFCVIDLETTGGRAEDGGITEIGAARFRGGELLGTFRTFTAPGCPIPARISMLTGITDPMVRGAPSPSEALPTLLEFIGDAVIVGHNVRYDMGYLDALMARTGREAIPNPRVDTLPLARRLLRDEVPDFKLGTLAERLRLPNRPSHRALDDVLATADLLHLLLERAGRLGVLGLDDLRRLPTVAGHPQAGKLALTEALPRRPGVYLFRDGAGRTLYVGKATDLRSRVRSYFSGDERRKVGQLLRETERIDHVVCPSTLEAEVLEVRLIHRLEPRFNRQLKTWRRYVYLKLTEERFPRLSIVRTVRDDALHLGPLRSHRAAKRVAEAIETAVPIRRCTGSPSRSSGRGPCAAAQIGVAACPCSGEVSEAEYGRHVDTVRRGILEDPSVLLAPVEIRMRALAADGRFEEAADMRDRAAALSDALRRQRRFDRLRRAGRVTIDVDGGTFAELDHGRLVRAWQVTRRGVSEVPLPFAPDTGDPAPETGGRDRPSDRPGSPVPSALADELLCIARWIDREAHRVVVVSSDGPLLDTGPPLPTYEPARVRSGAPELTRRYGERLSR